MGSHGNLVDDGEHIFPEGGGPVLAAQALEACDGEMDDRIMSDKAYRKWGGSRYKAPERTEKRPRGGWLVRMLGGTLTRTAKAGANARERYEADNDEPTGKPKKAVLHHGVTV